MKVNRSIPSLILVALLPAVFLGSSTPVWAQTKEERLAEAEVPKASAPQTISVTYQFENHQRMITVKNGKGDYMWGGLIATKNARLLVEIQSGKKILFAVADDKGKRVWEKAEPMGERADFVFNAGTADKTGSTGVTLGIKPRDASDTTSYPKTTMNGVVLLSEENQIVEGNFKSSDGTRMQLKRTGSDLAMTTYQGDQKTDEGVIHIGANGRVSTTVNGQEVMASPGGDNPVSLKDSLGTATIHSIKRDGKSYIELVVGERHILIEGTNFTAKSEDGVIFISIQPTSDAPPQK